jgi:hypothetical protein
MRKLVQTAPISPKYLIMIMPSKISNIALITSTLGSAAVFLKNMIGARNIKNHTLVAYPAARIGRNSKAW